MTRYIPSASAGQMGVRRAGLATAGRLAAMRVGPNTPGSAAGTTSITPAYPSGISTGDLLILCVVNKYSPNAPSTPSGWTQVAQANGGAGAAGVDTGDVYSTLFYKIADGTETGTLSVTIPSGNDSAGVIRSIIKDSAGTFSVTGAGGADNTDGTDFACVTGSSLTGDTAQGNGLLFVGFGYNSDATAKSAETHAVPGLTISSTLTGLFNGIGTAGDDVHIQGGMFAVVAGSCTNQADTVTATLSNSKSGAVAVALITYA